MKTKKKGKNRKKKIQRELGRKNSLGKLIIDLFLTKELLWLCWLPLCCSAI